MLLRHLSWENRQNPIHLCHQRHTRSRNSLVLFTPKLKGLINASLYSAQQNGHWTQSAAARRSAAVALLSLSVSAELALLNVSNPQYCRVRQASQTPTLFFSVKLIFSFIVSKLKKSRNQKSGDKNGEYQSETFLVNLEIEKKTENQAWKWRVVIRN